MSFGKTIRIYLADGTATGIRHAELVNWTGQAIVCPRGRLAPNQAPGGRVIRLIFDSEFSKLL